MSGTSRRLRAAMVVPVAVLLVMASGCGDDEPIDQGVDLIDAEDPVEDPATDTDPDPSTDDDAADGDGESGDAGAVDEAPTTVEVEIFFSHDERGDPCGDVFGLPREVDADDPVTGALEVLLAGPTASERAEGYGGWFSEETAGMLRGVERVGDTVHVDFDDLRPVIANASTSCGSAALLAQLRTTVLAADGSIEEIRYSIEGDEQDFYEWLQFSVPD